MAKQAPPDRVDAARQAEASLREATRAAHEAAQELRAASREAKTLLDALLPAAIRAKVEAALVPLIEEMTATIGRNTEEATAAVFRRFDVLAANLLGEVPGEEPLEDTVRRYQARVQEAETAGIRHPALRTIPAERVTPTGGRL